MARRPQRPFTVGFAAETERVAANARGKLAAKGLDMIAANAVGKDGTGFEAEDNALHVLWTGGGTFLPRAPKEEIARALVGLITERYRARTTQGSTENRRPSRRR